MDSKKPILGQRTKYRSDDHLFDEPRSKPATSTTLLAMTLMAFVFCALIISLGQFPNPSIHFIKGLLSVTHNQAKWAPLLAEHVQSTHPLYTSPERSLWSNCKSQPARLSDSFTFAIPTNSSGIFIASRLGEGFANVHVEVVQAEESTVGSIENIVSVKVTSHYDGEIQQALLERFEYQICQMNFADNLHGVGVFQADQNGPQIPLNMGMIQTHITITLPRRDVPLVIQNLNINTVGPVSHHIGNLSGSVHFESISLHSTSAMPQVVQVKSLSASHAVIKTNNSAIEGRFEVTDTLDLVTSNAPIHGFSEDVEHSIEANLHAIENANFKRAHLC
ncbi:hypothetical protein BT96DRAFT_993739 [Gymnopus androsaceus JB14]|uniref:Adhesin domain-containing protein n=1 Tax=Gymnopus androsaceus JB14 TaxID=1447944 RepID=A0A6A4HSJ3_9AGAR|nr:hypothetical protein BT96DRAFT_993739 [Gymnopus androsaceus JB14]